MNMDGFMLACAAIGLPALFLVWLEYRSRPREDRRTAGLRAANRDPGKGARR